VVLEYLVPTWGIKEKATGAPLELKPKAFTDLQALPHAWARTWTNQAHNLNNFLGRIWGRIQGRIECRIPVLCPESYPNPTKTGSCWDYVVLYLEAGFKTKYAGNHTTCTFIFVHNAALLQTTWLQPTSNNYGGRGATTVPQPMASNNQLMHSMHSNGLAMTEEWGGGWQWLKRCGEWSNGQATTVGGGGAKMALTTTTKYKNQQMCGGRGGEDVRWQGRRTTLAGRRGGAVVEAEERLLCGGRGEIAPQ
jgi:hypothetical protein